MSYIEVKNLNKIFNRKKRRQIEFVEALKDVSFTIEQGEILGYLGVNGAGKSTTIKILSGIIRPSKGSVNVAGIEPYKNRKSYVKNIGVMFGQRSQLEWDLPAMDTYLMLKKIYEIPTEQFWRTFNTLSTLLNLDGIEQVPVRHLSLGQKTKCELVATFIHSPSLVFLDEPTIGLDIKVKENIHKVIEEINKEFETTIFITSHDLSDIEKVAERIIIINEGEIYYDGSIKKLLAESGRTHEILIEIHNGTELIVDDSHNIRVIDETNYIITLTNKDDFVGTLTELIAKNKIVNLKINEVTLENVLIELYNSF